MDLIKVELRKIGEVEVNSVDARELWFFLGVGRDFTNWIKERVAKYGFIEDVDFRISAGFGENPSAGRPQSTYAISMDMAKELAMVENNDKGREARRYFIECEKRLKSDRPDVVSLMKDPAALRTLLLNAIETNMALQEKVAEQAPMVESLQKITASAGSLCISDAARTLNVPQRKLFDYLRRERWIFRRVGCAWDVPHAERLRQGYMEMKTTTIERDGKEDKIVEQARVTPLGLAKLATLKIV